MKKLFLAISVLGCLFVSQIQAAEQHSRFYLNAPFGYSFSTNPSKNGTFKGKMGKSPIFGVGVGYYLADDIRLETNLLMRSGFKFTSKSLVELAGGLEFKEEQKQKNKAVTLMANIYKDFAVHPSIVPYITAGVGISKISLGNYTVTTTIDNRNPISTTTPKSSKNSLSWQLGLGAYTKLSEQVNLDLSYRYTHVGSFSLKHPSSPTKLSGKIRGHEILLAIKVSL